jgi:O-methyltransferase/8-demethyl-8-(2,3-dimethoxy-alpha-L-rhamnosyl)tetracenomycin-C 4'-O-methyltransferase
MNAPYDSDAYIDLLKRSVTNYCYLGGDAPFETFRCSTHYDVKQGQWKIDPLARPITLLSQRQLDLVERSILDVERRGVPGDFIEAGVWRGGVIILMRAMLNAHNIARRKVVAADSFAGIPKNTRALNDPVDGWRDRWVASLEEVKQNVARFGLLDERIEFLPGFFSETLTALAGRQFALMRLDSDSYDSVEESLVYLYPLLSKGGVIIIDDWHLVGCKAAVENYRARHGVAEQIQVEDGNAYWVKA